MKSCTEVETILGQIIILYLVIRILCFFWYIVRVYFLTKIGFRKQLKDYGEWAVVTGATDGIGKEYAKQLAENGLNVVLISRTKEKLEKVSKEIESVHSVKTKIVVFDFSNQEDYDLIEQKLKGLQIGILINNVGMVLEVFDPFIQRNIDDVVKLMNTNMMSCVRMTHMLLPAMVKRNMGAVIHVTSGVILKDFIGLGLYPSAKNFMEKMTRMLQIEHSGIVQNQLLIPMGVSTNMSKEKPGPMVPSAQEYVQSAIRTIGVVNVTCGYLSHEFMYLLLKILPTSIVNYIYKKTVLDCFKND